MASKDVSPKEKANLKTLSKYVRLNLGTAAHSRPIEIPNLTDLQKISYEKFLKEGLPKILSDISPITDYTGKNFRLEFFGLHMGQPKFGPEASVQKGLSFDAPLTVSAKLLDLELQSSQTQEVYLGDIPQMTDRGTFIINGVERTVVSQLSRSPGVYFEREQDPLMAKFLYTAEVRPERGVWLRFETGRDCSLWVRMQRAGRKICAATILRAFGLKQKEIEEAFGPDEDPSRPFLKNTLAHDASHTPEEAFLEIYGKLRPGDPRILENAKNFKRSWIELGRSLYSVWKDKMYKTWGYSTFDAYTSKEINIRKNDIAEIISGPFKREKCKVTRIDKSKEDVVVELLEAAVPIPITVKLDAVKVIRRETDEEKE